jgi:hypothetical protein
MAPGEPIAGSDPFGMESRQRRIIQVDAGKDVASTVGEEHAVRARPPPLWVSFDAGFEPIHAKTVPEKFQ